MKDKKLMFGIVLAFIFLASVGFSYAYFSSTITNKDVKDQIVETGTLQLTFTDGPEINMQNIKPGTTITKEVSVKNTGTLEASYNVIWQELTNEIINDEMLIEATCTSSSGTCESIESSPISEKIIKKAISIASGVTHTYKFTITFKETDLSQNYNQGKKFIGVLGIEESKDNICNYSENVSFGTKFNKGIYTYSYNENKPAGWSVELTNKDSTDPVTEAPCTKVNDDYVYYMSGIFENSKASVIDVSNFDTSNVINMTAMFADSAATEIKGLDKIDTSNVIAMSGMFAGSKVETLDLSNFDTSNVTYMSHMFAELSIDELDLSNLNTSNVREMSYLFADSKISSLIGLDKLDKSSLEEINNMFDGTNFDVLDLSGFDVNRSTSLEYMFHAATINKLIFDGFGSSDISSMNYMFDSANIGEIVGLETLATGFVSEMINMFANSKIDSLDFSGFDTSDVTDMTNMFANSKINTLDLSSFDVDSSVVLDGMFDGASATVGYAKDEETADRFNDSSVTGIPDTLRFTVN